MSSIQRETVFYPEFHEALRNGLSANLLAPTPL